MDIALTGELETYIEEQVRAGRYGSAREVVEEALRSQMEKDDRAYLRERLQLAEEDVMAGRVVKADDAFFESLRERNRVKTMPAAE